jgi:hypothetical protein
MLSSNDRIARGFCWQYRSREGNNMSHSYARRLKMACLECGRDFSADVYIIVDTAERPDLLEKIRSGTLHEIPCSHCGHRGPVEVPLLVFRPDHKLHLVFAFAAGMDAEWNQQQAKELIGQLRKSLGRAWRDEWVREGLQAVQDPSNLPAALSDDPQTAIREAAQEQERKAARMKREDPERYYLTLFNAFVSAQDISRKRAIVQRYPDLLCDEAQDILQARMAKAVEDRNTTAAAAFSQNLLLLAMWRGEFEHS